MISQFEEAMRHETYIQRLASGISNARIDPAYVDINALVLRYLDGYSVDMSQREFNALRKDIATAIEKKLTPMWDKITADLGEMADYEASYQSNTIAAIADIEAAAISAAAIEAKINRPLVLGQGASATVGLWSEYVAGNKSGLYDLVDKQLRIGRVEGLTREQVVTQLVGTKKAGYSDGLITDKGRRWAQTLVQTGMSHYANAARDACADTFGDSIEGKVFSNVFDNRTTVQCFSAETPVLAFGRVINIFRSKYIGETVTIRTASGKKLVGTPNHPILTACGFLPMGELDPDKHVVYSPLLDSAILVGNQNISMETTIGELFDSFNKPSTSSISSKCSSTNDFYGDGYGRDDEVDIVTPNGVLRYDIKTIFDKPFSHKLFGFVFNWLPFDGFCLFARHLFSWLPVSKAAQVASSKSKVGIKKAFGSTCFDKYFGWAASCFKHFNCFVSVPDDKGVSNSSWERFKDPVALKKGCHGGGRAIVLGSNFSSGKPIPVLVDNIVSVERKFAKHYVYTLETDNGAYIAGGIVVKNCLHHGQQAHQGKVYARNDPKAPRIPLHQRCRSLWIYVIKGVDPFGGTRSSVGGNRGTEAANEFDSRNTKLAKQRADRAAKRAEGLETPETASKVRYKGKKDAGIFEPGQIEADISPQKFFERQPDWWIKSNLGATRAKLFREGGLTIDKFTDKDGNFLTLKQMRELDEYSPYFKKAGL